MECGDTMESQQQFQLLIQELQLVSQQLATFKNQEREMEITIEQVENQPAELSLYRQTGSILSEVGDRKSLLSELNETKGKLSEAISQLSDREVELREGYEKLAKEIEGQ